jgi:25S rRNA (uracil2843-N3)-methyltransferase
MSKYVRKEKSERKHPIISSSSSIIKAPVNPAAIKGRPEWKGPGFVKKTAKQSSRPAPSSSVYIAPNIQENRLSTELQQLLLNIFRTTFPICQDYETLKSILTEIKKALDGQDFERAFGSPESMEAYAVRWSPSRALCYAAVLAELCEEFREETCIQGLLIREASNADRSSKSSRNMSCSAKAVCFAGGPAEIMAFGALLRYLCPDSGAMTTQSVSTSGITSPLPGSKSGSGSSPPSPPLPLLDLHIVNATSWTAAISSLQSGLTTPPTLSKYASASARANNAAFICPSVLKTSFQQCNILEADQNELSSMIGKGPVLITLFSTVNDFLASNVAKYTAFLLKLSNAAPNNSLLLIIDNLDAKNTQENEKKTYPMNYLLDLVLTEKQLSAAAGQKPAWEKLLGNQNRLFRVPEILKYRIGLENFRFQVYLFKKL